MSYTDAQIWTVVALLGAGTFLIRFSFLGLIGDRKLPVWLLRHLRYTAVAILPALVAPLVLWPGEAGESYDPARILAAGATLGIGYVTGNPIWAILGGFATFLGLGFVV
jgi:branched-subunit amino acid transport protein